MNRFKQISREILYIVLLSGELFALLFSIFFFGFNCFTLDEGEPFPWDITLFSFITLVNIGLVSSTIFPKLVLLLKRKKS